MLIIYKRLGVYRVLSYLCVCFLCASCQVQSCSEYFGYESDDRGVHGVVSFRSFCPVSSLWVRAAFMVAGQLPSSYVGSIQPISTELCLHPDFNKTMTVKYMVNFPVTTSLPRLISLNVNNNDICQQTEDIFGEAEVVTQINLQHVLLIKSESNGFANVLYNHKQSLNNSGNTPGNDRARFTQKNNVPSSGPIITSNKGIDIKMPEKFDPPSSPIQSNQSYSMQCGTIDVSPTVTDEEYYIYKRGEWPWVVTIYRKKKNEIMYLCLGTLVSDRHVITAAHCTTRSYSSTPAREIIVKAGVYDFDDPLEANSVSRRLESVSVSEVFDTRRLLNDVSLMTLEKPLPLGPYIKPICLWSGDTHLDKVVGVTGFLAGWGRVEKDGKSEALAIRMPIVSPEQCIRSKTPFMQLTSPTTLCAGSRNGSGPCTGDSGGGLYVFHKGRWTLRGVLSTSLINEKENAEVQCDLEAYLIFTDAAKFLPWIHGIIDKKSV